MRENRASKRTLDAILRGVREQPGVTVSALRALLGFDEKTIRVHLRRLVRDGAVSTEPAGGVCRFYVRSSDVPTAEAQRVHAVLSRPGPRSVYASSEAEGTTVGRIAERLGLPPSHVLRTLLDLERSGLVRRLARNLWQRQPTPHAWAERMAPVQNSRPESAHAPVNH